MPAGRLHGRGGVAVSAMPVAQVSECASDRMRRRRRGIRLPRLHWVGEASDSSQSLVAGKLMKTMGQRLRSRTEVKQELIPKRQEGTLMNTERLCGVREAGRNKPKTPTFVRFARPSIFMVPMKLVFVVLMGLYLHRQQCASLRRHPQAPSSGMALDSRRGRGLSLPKPAGQQHPAARSRRKVCTACR